MQERHVTAEARRFLDEGRMQRKLPNVPTLVGHRFLRLYDLGAFRWVKNFLGTMVFGRPRFGFCGPASFGRVFSSVTVQISG